MKQAGLRAYFTKTQLAEGAIPDTTLDIKFLNSYSPEGGWYVMGVQEPYTVGPAKGTDHASPYTYDTHVPLAFYGLPFRPGTYRTHSEPVDMAATLASLLGINAPTHAVGRVLTEALAPAPRGKCSRANSCRIKCAEESTVTPASTRRQTGLGPQRQRRWNPA